MCRWLRLSTVAACLGSDVADMPAAPGSSEGTNEAQERPPKIGPTEVPNEADIPDRGVAREAESLNSVQDVELADPSTASLARLVKWHPTFNFFLYAADRMLPAHWSPEQRARHFALEHPRWFRFSYVVDALLTASVSVAVVVILARLAWKTLGL